MQNNRDLLWYRCNIKRNSTGSKILESSYVSGFSLLEISKKTKKQYRYTKKIVLELKYSGYLESESKGRYSITQKGRWFVICQRLGLSFLSLCLLAEVYHRVNSNPEFFYQFSSFRQCYETGYDENFTYMAIYRRQNISKSLKHLTSRNLVYALGDFIKMTNTMIEFLKKYHRDLESLFLWCSDMYEKCICNTIENNNFNASGILQGSN
ncbi:MAG: winged helix-turn-helix domain-containing protein [Nitrosopumilus sp.]|nr:winged helix-turn-helix domain-containing protein [Nitrosopumilus sp.]